MIIRPWSCDSFVALPDTTRNGSVVFGKNSDRPAGEAQPLRRHPARAAGAPLHLAYVTVDDAPAYAHIGSAPFWCWGYEIGVNEHRVAIGNEAVFTRPWAAAVAREKAGDTQAAGLLGMELVRLGLERGGTAREALSVITGLLERHGQWGSAIVGAPHVEGAYDNSFLIADPREAWVLETMGRDWAARRLTHGSDSISNELTIRTDADLTSAGLRDAAAGHGWPADRPLDIADAFTDPHTPLQVSHIRRRRSHQLLTDAAPHGIDVDTAKRVLRDHLEDSFLGGPSFDAARPDFHTLCMHEHPSGFTWGNTAASLVVELSTDTSRPTTLWWCPVTPCTGAYLPITLEADALPDPLTLPTAPGATWDPRDHRQPQHDPASVWWRFQHLLDAAKDPASRDFAARAARLRAVFDELETRWSHTLPTLVDAPAELADFTRDCLAEASAAATRLAHEFGADPGTAVDPRWAPPTT